MFDNIGGKIKTLAQVVCWIGIIGSVISGIVMIATDDDLAFLGVIVIVIGSLVSWVSSFTLYGFGHLIENTDLLILKVEKLYSRKEEPYLNEKKSYSNKNTENGNTPHRWACNYCGKFIDRSPCPYCGNK
ncbi:MAG: hypothetical protein J1G06_04650 [Oscillospiraceae bacterium]|nr:hypothetical protein [Oscillospiraceae bacterium]